MCIYCGNKERLVEKFALVPTANFSTKFGRVYICENCKCYYAKMNDEHYIEVDFIREPGNIGEWRVK